MRSGLERRGELAKLYPKEFTAFRMAPELMEAMRKLKARDGVPFSVQIDFALREWLKKKGIVVELKTGRERAGTRRRP